MAAQKGAPQRPFLCRFATVLARWSPMMLHTQALPRLTEFIVSI